MMRASEFFDPPRPRLFGHRGSNRYPENTLPAFKDAGRAGLIYLELDVRTTLDQEVVVHHDPTLTRICGRDRKICDVTLAEIKELDAGYTFNLKDSTGFPWRGQGITVPTLAEVLVELPGRFLVIEIKEDRPEAAALVVKAVTRARAEERVLLASAEVGTVATVRGLAPQMPTNLSYPEVEEFYQRLALGDFAGYRPVGRALQIPPQHQGMDLLRPEAIERAHRLNLEVHVWTINDPREIKRVLGLGVDGIMSDDPWLFKDLLLGR